MLSGRQSFWAPRKSLLKDVCLGDAAHMQRRQFGFSLKHTVDAGAGERPFTPRRGSLVCPGTVIVSKSQSAAAAHAKALRTQWQHALL